MKRLLFVAGTVGILVLVLVRLQFPVVSAGSQQRPPGGQRPAQPVPQEERLPGGQRPVQPVSQEERRGQTTPQSSSEQVATDSISAALLGGYLETVDGIVLNEVIDTAGTGTASVDRTVQYQIGTVAGAPVFVRVRGDLSVLSSELDELASELDLDAGRTLETCQDDERICRRTCEDENGEFCCLLVCP